MMGSKGVVLWVMFLLCNNLVVIPVISISNTNFGDAKNYYSSPDPHGSSGNSHSTSPTHHHSTSGHHSSDGNRQSNCNTPPTPSGGGSGHYYPSPTPTPPTHHGGGSGTGGGCHCPSPPSTPSTPSTPTPLTPITPPTPSSGGSGGYYGPPTTPVIRTPPSPLVPSPPYVTPVTPIVPSPPLVPRTPTLPPFDPNTPPFSCNYWGSHPTMIFGVLGWWATVGGLFGVTSLPGLNSPDMSLQQILTNPRKDGYGSLYREATASFLNSMASRNFPFSTRQVKDAFASSLSSDKAAAAQARLFKLANEGRLKH